MMQFNTRRIFENVVKLDPFAGCDAFPHSGSHKDKNSSLEPRFGIGGEWK
jgi:hypothetical protein